MSGEDRSTLVYGRNPVRELIAAGRRRVHEVRALPAAADEPWLGSVPVRRATKDELARMAKTGDHQGVVARVDPYPYAPEAELIRSSGAIFCLDGAQDPRNVGAIARSIDAAGLGGMALPERGSPGVTPVVAKASAGAVEHLTIARVANPVAFVHDAAARGRLIVGADQERGVDYREMDWPADVVVVVGAEGSGLRPKMARALGARVRIPMRGHIASLNVSVAAALLAFEITRNRN
jgi:23S rRNA (guanosine2251-2'-O)-methyltransferase